MEGCGVERGGWGKGLGGKEGGRGNFDQVGLGKNLIN